MMRVRQLGKYTTRRSPVAAAGRGSDGAGRGSGEVARHQRDEARARDGGRARGQHLEQRGAAGQRARERGRAQPGAGGRARRAGSAPRAQAPAAGATGGCAASRISLISAPVSILTGHEVAHIESPAQVSVALVGEVRLHLGQGGQRLRRPLRPERGHRAREHDALPRRDGEVARGAARLAEAALHAAVGGGRDRRQRLQRLEVHLGVVVEQHARVEDAVGVEQALHALHHGVGLVAPLVAHEGRDVAPGAVLGLERAVVFPHHQVHQLAHERAVARHRVGRARSPARRRSAGSRRGRARR